MAAVAAAVAPALNRDALLREAVSLGYQEDELQRTPTYALASMVSERRKKKKNKERGADDPGRTGQEDVEVYAHQLADVGQTVERLALQAQADEVAPDATAAGANDDAKTVVNMDFITSTENPSDQKYKRFSFLAAAKSDLTKAIKTNTELLQQVAEKLDADDVMVIRHDIQQAQMQLELVLREMREIHQWFSEVHQQKHEFYQQFLQHSKDLTGNLTCHFQRKMQNIQKYMVAMTEQAQLQVGDLK